jgi:transcriptional regulator with XRE-family HTH domain
LAIRLPKQERKKIFHKPNLAQQIAISPQAVGKWQRGESLPDISTLIRLAELVGVDLHYFSDKFHLSTGEIYQYLF